MVNFCQYYVDFLQQLIKNVGDFFASLFSAIIKFFGKDIGGYLNSLLDFSERFNFLDWICYIIVFLINIGLIAFIVIFIVYVVKRKLRVRRKQFEKEQLLEEIESLNYKIEELINEKNQIFAMKVSGINAKATQGTDLSEERSAKEKEKKIKVTNSRFTKLIAVDEKYEMQITNVNMTPDDMLSLPQLVERFVNFAASQMRLYYSKETVAIFFAGLATSKVMILEGISGTGKTSLPYAMGKFFQNDSAIVSVQPSWRDRAEILGYLNEFTKKFNETDFLKALYETTYREDLNFIILDEMNLARIEYYFAEFLSIMEMPDPSEWKIDLVPESLDSDPKNVVNGKILVPQNVWFIGTANKDDSTFTITDKVYDRATVIEMNHRASFIDAPVTPPVTMSYEYLDSLFTNALQEFAMSNKSIENVQKLDRFIADNFKVTFGNRILKQLRTFVPVFVACGFKETTAIDYFIARKVLRKFESLNLSFLHKELEDLIVFLDKLYGKGVFSECQNYIKDLIKNS